METREIAINKLAVAGTNVRRSQAKDDIESLAASIDAHGLINPLTVVKNGSAMFYVIAGQRRLYALQYLVKSKKRKATDTVTCNVREATEAEQSELSLAENIERSPMNPADEILAYKELVAGGATPADIALRFGVPEIRVARRLKLATLSDKMLERLKAGKMTLDQAAALTLLTEQEAEKLWKAQRGDQKGGMQGYQLQPDRIRAMAVEHKRYCGIEWFDPKLYTDAGGTITADLFGDDKGDRAYFDDAKLFDQLQLAAAKQRAAELVEKKGWGNAIVVALFAIEPGDAAYELQREDYQKTQRKPANATAVIGVSKRNGIAYVVPGAWLTPGEAAQIRMEQRREELNAQRLKEGQEPLPAAAPSEDIPNSVKLYLAQCRAGIIAQRIANDTRLCKEVVILGLLTSSVFSPTKINGAAALPEDHAWNLQRKRLELTPLGKAFDSYNSGHGQDIYPLVKGLGDGEVDDLFADLVAATISLGAFSDDDQMMVVNDLGARAGAYGALFTPNADELKRLPRGLLNKFAVDATGVKDKASIEEIEKSPKGKLAERLAKLVSDEDPQALSAVQKHIMPGIEEQKLKPVDECLARLESRKIGRALPSCDDEPEDDEVE